MSYLLRDFQPPHMYIIHSFLPGPVAGAGDKDGDGVAAFGAVCLLCQPAQRGPRRQLPV